ncbi:MAG: hypothetical protein AAF408_09275 [Pseudomonadota bacterium]
MTVPNILSLIGYFSIPQENAAKFRKNCAAMIDLKDREPGHLASAYSFAGEGQAVSREDYDSADAVLKHMEIGQHVFESTRELVEITAVEIHGPAQELARLREPFSAMSPRYFVTEFGFRR